MASGQKVSPLVFDIDAKARRMSSEIESVTILKKAVRFAAFVFVKTLVEYVVKHSSSSPRCPKLQFWMSDASGPRGEGKFKFSYHMVVRCCDTGSGDDDGEAGASGVTKTFNWSSSRDLCVLLNKCMEAHVVNFNLAGADETETADFQSVMEAMKATLRSEMSADDLKGGIFDEQIYKSCSLRLFGAQRPNGGNELKHVDTESGNLRESLWSMDDAEEREALQRGHDPFPSEKELLCTLANIIPCKTKPPMVIDSDDDDDEEKRKLAASKLNAIVTGGFVPKGAGHGSHGINKMRVSRTNLALCHSGEHGGCDVRGELTKLCTTLFKIFCGKGGAIPSAHLPERYEFQFRNIKLCRPHMGDSTTVDMERQAVVPNKSVLMIRVDPNSQQQLEASHAYDNNHYYSMEALSPFCPWKSSRCGCKGEKDKALANHNQRRIIMEVHPKCEKHDAHMKLMCFSSACAAAMADRYKGVAIARYPKEDMGRPSMRFTEAVFQFAKVAGRASC